MLISSNLELISCYSFFKDEKFIITNIIIKDYGIRLDLKGKEKVIGYLYYDEDKIDEFVSSFELGDEVLVSGNISDINNNTVPDTFNYKKYLYSNKIYNVIEITDISKINDNENIFYLLASTESFLNSLKSFMSARAALRARAPAALLPFAT